MIGVLASNGTIAYYVSSVGPGDDTSNGIVEDVPPEALSGLLVWQNGQWVEQLPRAKAAALERIDMAVSRVLLTAAGPHPEFESARASKREELARYLSTTPETVTQSDYPFLAAEVEARGLTPAAVIAEWAAAVTQWRALGSRLEAARVAGRADVRAAASLAAIAAAEGAALQEISEIAAELAL